MTAPRADPAPEPDAGPPPVEVRAADPRRAALLRRRCPPARARRDRVVVAAGATVDDALGVAPAGWWFDGTRLVLVVDEVSPAATRRAVGLGVRVVLGTDRATPARLAAAVGAAGDGDGRVPAGVLAASATGRRTSPAPALTPRQTAVVTLLAEGRSNGEIAAALSCSAHTVKNVVYDLMARLGARTRSQAVAHAVRAGLV